MLFSLQSLRGIFAIFIFLHHCADFSAGGDCGVAFFIILSGFVLCNGYESRIKEHRINFRDFINKRLARFYPLHLICLLAAIVLQLGNVSLTLCLIWIINALLIQSWIPIDYIYFSGNAVSWCLSDFVFFYCLFPYLIRAITNTKSNKKANVRILGLIAIICYFIAVFVIPERYSNSIIYVNPISRIFDFILGILLWQWWHSHKNNNFIVSLTTLSFFQKSIIELTAALLLTITIILYPDIHKNFAVASYWWIPTAILILVFSIFENKGGIVTWLLQRKFAIHFGNVSFSFYMIHVLALNYTTILLDKLNITLSEAIYLPSLFILTVVGAFIISKYFETPISNWWLKKSKLPQQAKS